MFRKCTVLGGDQAQLKRKKSCGDDDKFAFLGEIPAGNKIS